MKSFSRAAVALLAAAALTAGSSGSAVPARPDDKTILHVLNRIGYGARPGDVDRVRQIGLAAYIDQQLHPERIADTGMTARLAGFDTLKMSSRQLAEEYYVPALEARQQVKRKAGKDAATKDDPAMKPDAAADGKPVRTPEQMELARKSREVLVELTQQKILRAAYSDRQLEEVMTDFWFNHFNVFAGKGPTQQYLTEYERDAIRPHVFGKFRDLLEATAKSPAMLFYLDNWMSAGSDSPQRRNQKTPRGLNENYGRELMELQTLGVDGGYTQKDVTEVARAFTGWTIRNPRTDGEFFFNERLHDEGQKIVLGHVIRSGGGERDGQQVLDILARHPSTARFIATKLVRRFVSDMPPPALVDRAAERFRRTDGDLREVVRVILRSPEFYSTDVYHAKIKTPFEFVVSAVRATGADVQDARLLVRQIAELGMPLYQCQPPTGYKDTADAWVNTGALVGRMNFGLALADNKIRGVTVTTSTPDGITLGSPEFQRR
jgi:uncharacterized protein (DUF1800 family)